MKWFKKNQKKNMKYSFILLLFIIQNTRLIPFQNVMPCEFTRASNPLPLNNLFSPTVLQSEA